jgi:hypothetical protein
MLAVSFKWTFPGTVYTVCTEGDIFCDIQEEATNSVYKYDEKQVSVVNPTFSLNIASEVLI